MLGQSPVPTQAWLGSLGLQLNHLARSQDALVGAGPRGWAGGWVKVQLATCNPRQEGPSPPTAALGGGGHPLVARFWGPGLGLPPGPGGSHVRAGVVPGSCIQDSTLNGFDQPKHR